jgi:hypothetical protein
MLVREGVLMSIALYAADGLLIALLLYSAALKLSGRPEVVEAYARVGVPVERLSVLAAVLIVGVVGLAVGLAWPVIGVAAAGAFIAYFVLALGAHARHGDLEHAAVPAVILVLAVTVEVLFVLR